MTFIPMTNAIGFYDNKREELKQGEYYGRDPNRDFAFNLHPGEACARTAAGQVRVTIVYKRKS
jgi:hypothetical protein